MCHGVYIYLMVMKERNSWGTLVYEVGYHPRKKIHVIRVFFFRTRQCTCIHRLGVQKRAKFGKKRHVFGYIDKFWKGHDAQIKKNACKDAYLGSIFIPVKYRFRVCFESPFTRMISSLKYKKPQEEFQMYFFISCQSVHQMWLNTSKWGWYHQGPNCDFVDNVFYRNQWSFWHKNLLDTIFHSKDKRKINWNVSFKNLKMHV